MAIYDRASQHGLSCRVYDSWLDITVASCGLWSKIAADLRCYRYVPGCADEF